MCYVNWTPMCSIYANSRWIDANLFHDTIQSLYWCTNLENFYSVLSSLDDMCDMVMASARSRFPSGTFILYDDPILQTIRADIDADRYHDDVDENLDRIITFINFNKVNRNSFESILNITWNTTNCHHG